MPSANADTRGRLEPNQQPMPRNQQMTSILDGIAQGSEQQPLPDDTESDAEQAMSVNSNEDQGNDAQNESGQVGNESEMDVDAQAASAANNMSGAAANPQ